METSGAKITKRREQTKKQKKTGRPKFGVCNCGAHFFGIFGSQKWNEVFFVCFFFFAMPCHRRLKVPWSPKPWNPKPWNPKPWNPKPWNPKPGTLNPETLNPGTPSQPSQPSQPDSQPASQSAQPAQPAQPASQPAGPGAQIHPESAPGHKSTQ
jgi:hypothetical protein